MSCRITELRTKPVINICDGRKLGCVDDVLVDEASGCIAALIVPGPCRFLGCFCPENDYIIDWCKVKKISAELILVELWEPPRCGKHQRRLLF